MDLQCPLAAAVVQVAAVKEYTTLTPQNVKLGIENIKGFGCTVLAILLGCQRNQCTVIPPTQILQAIFSLWTNEESKHALYLYFNAFIARGVNVTVYQLILKNCLYSKESDSGCRNQPSLRRNTPLRKRPTGLYCACAPADIVPLIMRTEYRLKFVMTRKEVRIAPLYFLGLVFEVCSADSQIAFRFNIYYVR